MEELLLRCFPPSEKMDIVDQQEIGFAIPTTKVMHRTLRNRRDHVICELLGTDVHDPTVRVSTQDLMGYRLHQVGLSEPRGTVNEERIVGLPGCLGYGCRSGRGQFI